MGDPVREAGVDAKATVGASAGARSLSVEELREVEEMVAHMEADWADGATHVTAWNSWLPRLLAEVHALRQENAKLRGDLDAAIQNWILPGLERVRVIAEALLVSAETADCQQSAPKTVCDPPTTEPATEED